MKKVIVGALAVVGGATVLAGIAAVVEAVFEKKRYENLSPEEKERRKKLYGDFLDSFKIVPAEKHDEEQVTAEKDAHEESEEQSAD